MGDKQVLVLSSDERNNLPLWLRLLCILALAFAAILRIAAIKMPEIVDLMIYLIIALVVLIIAIPIAKGMGGRMKDKKKMRE